MKAYGDPPTNLGEFIVPSGELFLYQYLPIKLAGAAEMKLEPRLEQFTEIIGRVCCDYVGMRGLNAFMASYVYLTAKRMFVKPGKGFNRQGWHSDGFGTDDLNYVWCDSFPTVFNSGPFSLSADDAQSLADMEEQANPANSFTFPANTLLRLDQYSIHAVAEIDRVGVRTFIKISISPDRYDLLGNTHNYLLDYSWPMRERSKERNTPQLAPA